MGPLKSEYGRRYQDPLWQTYVGHYLEKVDYRSQRRQLEHRHQPFDWQCTDSDESDDDEPLAGKHDTQVKHNDITIREAHDQSVSAHMGREAQVEAGKPEKVQPKETVPVKKPQSKNKKSRKLKTKKHCETTKTPPQRKATKSVSPQKEPRKAPFLVYAMGDDRRAVGMKQTHNVNASLSNRKCVYPGALNAQMRRLLNEEEEAIKRQKRAKNKTVKVRPYLLMAPPSDHWQTEYQRNYSR